MKISVTTAKTAWQSRTARILAGLSVYLRPLCCREALFHAGVVDAQELRSPSNHVDIVVLSLGSLPIHEGVHGVSLVLALQYNGAYFEQCSP